MKKFVKLVAFAIICTVVSVFALTVSATDIYEDALPFNMDLLYGRSALKKMENGEKLVKLYDCIFEGIEKSAGSIDLEDFYIDFALENITYEQLNECVLLAYRYDNPQHFWVGNEYKFYGNPGEGIISSISVSYIDDVDTEEAKAEFKAAAEQLIVDAGVEDGMSEYEISLRLHDAVVKHVEYDHEFKEDNIYNAYGALIGKKAVCEGYAELYQYLLYLCGIQSHAVTGYAGGDHMWNLVRIDGEYYMSDPTWDDPTGNNTGRIFHEYLNVTTEKLDSEGRKIDYNGYDLPDCTATKAYYYNNYFCNTSNSNEPSAITVKPNIGAKGAVAICPVVSGTTLSANDIQELLNNTAVEVTELKNGNVATGSKLLFDGEEAVIAVKGDIDGDGVVTVFDANMAQKGESNFTAGYELQKFASDFDENGSVDTIDSQAIVDQIVS